MCSCLVHLLQTLTMDQLCEGNDSFAIKLLKLLGEAETSRNVFFSPLSISISLAMVYLGARGDTADQMSQVSMHATEAELGHLSSLLLWSWSSQIFMPAAGRWMGGQDVGGKVKCLGQVIFS